MTFIKSFLTAALLLLIPMFIIGTYIQPLDGDLTRLGRLSERDWGWNKPQPAISVRKNYANVAASVLVLGDSFSAENIWQSVAMDVSGLTFFTFHWNDIGPPQCLERWILSLSETYPSARYVIVETVERAFIDRFLSARAQEADKCVKRVVSSVRPKKLRTEVLRSISWNAMPDPVYAVKALLNGMKRNEKTERSGDAFMSPLTRSDLFSNKESGSIIFYKDDVAKQNWSVEVVSGAIDNLKKISVRANEQGLTVIIVVVPDKSTVYAPFFRDPIFAAESLDVWGEMRNGGVLSIDLKQAFKSEAVSNVDFYLPNNTHLGRYGYTSMGKLVATYIGSVSISH